MNICLLPLNMGDCNWGQVVLVEGLVDVPKIDGNGSILDGRAKISLREDSRRGGV